MKPGKGTPNGRQQRLHAAIAGCLEALESGGEAEAAAVRARYPEFAAELTEFLTCRAEVEQVVAPLRGAGDVGATFGGAQGGEAEAPTLPPSLPPSGIDAPSVGRRFRDYELLDEIARGGMGVVFKARQVSVNRVVALKMILGGALASADDVRRFRAEAEAVAGLDHPNIVPVHEVGESEGLHFFSMKFIEGGSLAQRPRLSVRERVGVMVKVARAVHYAHQRGVLHRDLKPANVLLDGAGEPYVTDFGLAKRVEGDSALTQSGAVVGTPGYMAPEQARAEKGLTTATDVYGLGAVLYELLTGRPPFRAATAVDTILQVLEQEPPRPRDLVPGVDRDLETICLKCLDKDPARRYDSARGLADDLERWRNGEPIRARRSGLWERGVKWARRRPAVAALLAVTALALVGGVVALGALWRDAEARAGMVRKLAAAQEELDERQGRLATLEGEFAAKEEGMRALDADRRAAERAARRALYIRDMQLAGAALDSQQEGRALQLVRQLRPAAGQADVRDFEWRYLWGRLHPERATLRGHASLVVAAAFAPDGQTIVTIGGDDGMRLWDAQGHELFPPPAESGTVRAAAFDPEGRLLTGGADGKVRAWGRPDRAGLGTPRWALAASAKAVPALAVSPDGQVIATGSEDGTAALWGWDGAAAEGPPALRHTLAGHTKQVGRALFSPDGKVLATISDDQTARLWDVSTGRNLSVLRGNAGACLFSLAFAPDGRTLALADLHPFSPRSVGWVRIVDPTTQRIQRFFQVAGGGASGVAFSPDGSAVAYGNNSGLVTVRPLDTRQPAETIHLHTGRVYAVAYSPDGRTLLTSSYDRLAKLTDVPRPEPWLRAHPGGASGVALSPDGKRLASGGADTMVCLWDLATRKQIAELRGHSANVTAVAFSPDGRWLASASEDRTVMLRDATAPAESVALRGHTGPVTCVAFSPDGRTIASGARGGTVLLWDMPPGDELALTARRKELPAPEDHVAGLAFSHDGKALAVARWAGGVTLYDAASGDVRGRLTPTVKGMSGGVAFSPDGGQVAAACWENGAVEVWDAASGARLRTLLGHTGSAIGVAYSPDGQTLFSSSRDGTVKLWDLATGLERFTLKGAAAEVGRLALSRDGRLLATAHTDGGVRLWLAPAEVPGEESEKGK